MSPQRSNHLTSCNSHFKILHIFHETQTYDDNNDDNNNNDNDDNDNDNDDDDDDDDNDDDNDNDNDNDVISTTYRSWVRRRGESRSGNGEGRGMNI